MALGYGKGEKHKIGAQEAGRHLDGFADETCPANRTGERRAATSRSGSGRAGEKNKTQDTEGN